MPNVRKDLTQKGNGMDKKRKEKAEDTNVFDRQFDNWMDNDCQETIEEQDS